jgi:hypothetical protein
MLDPSLSLNRLQMMQVLSKLDLFVAGTMRRTERLLAHLREHGVEEADLLEVEAWADSVGVMNAETSTPKLVEMCFGTPNRSELNSLLYDMQLWPKHCFRWAVDGLGRAHPVGLELRVAAEAWQPDAHIESIQTRVHPWYHTMTEVHEWFGTPAIDQSWGHSGHYTYGPLPDGTFVVLESDYGLVTSLTRKSSLRS